MLAHSHYGLCAGQWQDYQPLYEQHAATLNWQNASYLSREQQRRRECNSSLPLEEYRLAVVHHQLVNPATKTPFDVRVLFVHSTAAAKESAERRHILAVRWKNERSARCRTHAATQNSHIARGR